MVCMGSNAWVESAHRRGQAGRFAEMPGSAPESGLSASLREPSDHVEEMADGTRVWRDRAGLAHRADGGPAAVYPSGERSWFVHGRRKRPGGGPQVEYADGLGEYYGPGGDIVRPMDAREAARVAGVTRSQIPVGALMRVGARAYRHDEHDGSLVFDLKHRRRWHTLRVTLDPGRDEYRAVLSRQDRYGSPQQVERLAGIGAEQLGDVIASFDR